MSAHRENSAELSVLLRALEETLLDPVVRRDPERVAGLLSEDFEEFGSSGRVWSRRQILELLATESYQPPTMEDFLCTRIADSAALVTYKTVRCNAQTGQRTVVLRSSIWVEQASVWRIRFHQGTRATTV